MASCRTKRRASWRSGSVAMRWLNKVVERTGEGGGDGGGGGVGEGGGGRTAGGEGEGGGGRNSATQSRGQRPYTRPLVSTVHNLSHHLPPSFAVPTLAHAPMPTAPQRGGAIAHREVDDGLVARGELDCGGRPWRPMSTTFARRRSTSCAATSASSRRPPASKATRPFPSCRASAAHSRVTPRVAGSTGGRAAGARRRGVRGKGKGGALGARPSRL